MKDNDDENAKDSRWKVPMDLPGVKPEDYDTSITSAHGSAQNPKKGQVPPGNKKNKKPSKKGQKKKGQLPLHDEEIGGG